MSIMKSRALLFLAAAAAVLAFSACSKEEVKKNVKEIVATDLSNVIGTWTGTYTTLSLTLSEAGEIEVKAVEGDNEALMVDTKDIKDIKIKISANAAGVITGSAEKAGDIESGTLVYKKGEKDNTLKFTVNTTKESTKKSFIFSSKEKK